LLWEWRRSRRRKAVHRETVQMADYPKTSRQHDAAARARQLLMRLLTDMQLADYRRLEVVTVRTATATYEIGPRSLVIAHRRDDGREYALCIQFAHPADGAWLPAEDLMIAKLLLIRTDEDGLWQRFGPQAYRAGTLQDVNFAVPHGFVFGPGELYGLRHGASTVMVTGPPVHFTEDLVPYHGEPIPVAYGTVRQPVNLIALAPYRDDAPPPLLIGDEE
jgi:hypothetical protein